jgi:hypothetical protein
VSVEVKKPIFIGTVSYLLSHRSYPDFIKGGLKVNQLPLFSDAISTIQEALERIEPLELRHSGGSAAPKDLREYSPIEPFSFTIQGLFIESVSFESGSVYAKAKIGAAVAFIAYQGLADYKDVKEGFSELRQDVIQIVTNAFGVNGAGPVEGDHPQDDADIRFYFTQPRRIEEEVFRRRVKPINER